MGSVIRTTKNNEIHVTDTILTKDVHDKWHYSKANFKQLTSEIILDGIPALLEEKGSGKIINFHAFCYNRYHHEILRFVSNFKTFDLTDTLI